MRLPMTLALLLAPLLFPALNAGQAHSTRVDGRQWIKVNEPAPDSDDARCGNQSETRVLVARSPQRGVEMSSTSAVEIETSPDVPAFVLKSDVRPGGGDTLAHRVDDGWLVAFNFGEFGTTVWWFSHDGARRQRISDLPVIAFREFERVDARPVIAVIVSGLAYIGGPSGQLGVIEKSTTGNWVLRTLGDMDDVPEAVSEVVDDKVYVAARRSVFRISRDGRMEPLVRVDLGGLYPSSIVRVAEDERIYVGMRRYLLEIGPGPERVRTWYVPHGCAAYSFGRKSIGRVCECVGHEQQRPRPGRGR